MSAGKYWLLVFLSLVIAALIFLEIRCEIQVTSLTFSVGENEAHLSQAQQQNEVLRQLLQRMAVESQHDSALADLLAKRGLHVSSSRDTNAPVPPPTPPSAPTTTSPHD
jgi:predicted Holliday junction resolvase-like endonuclease